MEHDTPILDKFTDFTNGLDDATHLVALDLLARDLERLLASAMTWVYACECENQNRADMIARYEALTKSKP
jgi:hypothetical protein